MKRTVLHIVLVGLIIVLAYLVYNSINKVTSFNAEERYRIGVVADKMKHIRSIQMAYNSKYDEFASSWDTLMHFLSEDSLPVVLRIGTVPDSLTEREALGAGIVTRDTSYVFVRDSLFKPDQWPYDMENLPLIPYSSLKGKSEPDSFLLDAGRVERGNVKVPVFELIAPKEAYLKGMDETLIRREESIDLKVGSMTEATTDGNWE